ncbi:MAG TPA: hypothetical protein VMW52_02975 [Phycisphaerae bacterium]|nr:hypothetical protein [Phycisphaerae bacterium]
MSTRTWYVEARVGRANYRGDCVRYVDDRRGGDGEYVNIPADDRVAELEGEIAGLRARLQKVTAERDGLRELCAVRRTEVDQLEQMVREARAAADAAVHSKILTKG